MDPRKYVEILILYVALDLRESSFTDADAVIQQFYPGELGGLALAEIVFGDVNPSGEYPLHHRQLIFFTTIFGCTGKLPVSFPRSVATTPVFYNYIKGSRPADAGRVLDDGQLMFGHQVRRLPALPHDLTAHATRLL